MTNIEIAPATHLLPTSSAFLHRVVVTAGPWQAPEDGDEVGTVKTELAGYHESFTAYYNYVPITRAGVAHPHSITREGAAEWLVEHWIAQRQDVYLTVRVTVDREMWDLAYGEQGTDGDRAEDVRSYVSGILGECSQARPGGEGGVQDLAVDHF